MHGLTDTGHAIGSGSPADVGDPGHGSSTITYVPRGSTVRMVDCARTDMHGLPRWFSSAPLRRLVQVRRLRGQGLNAIADLTGIPRRRLQRALAGDRLRSDAADALAVAFGRHPSELWPDWFGGGRA
jgi:hypothetical protein